MAVINEIKGYFDLNLDKFKEENSTIKARTSNANQVQIICPIDSSLDATITFLLNNGRSVDWQSLTLQGTEEVEITEGVFETWNVWTYDVSSNVLSTVSLTTSSPLFYQARFREQDIDFVGIYTTSNSVLDNTDEALINAELKVEYGVLDNGKFITVTNATENASTTYQSDGTDYIYLGFEKPQYIQVLRTNTVKLSIFPSINSNETSLSASEIDIIRNWIQDLETDISVIEESLKQTTDGAFDTTNDSVWSSDKRTHNHLENNYMRTDQYDTEATATLSVKYARNLKGTSEDISADDVIDKTKLLDQSVKTTASPEFVNVTVQGNNVETQNNKGQANGYAGLDGDAKVPRTQLPNIKVFIRFFGSTSGDLPTTGNTNLDFYICEENGYLSETAGVVFEEGDTATYIQATDSWIKNDAIEGIETVNGQIPDANKNVEVKANHINREDDSETIEESLDNIEQEILEVKDSGYVYKDVTQGGTNNNEFYRDALETTLTNGRVEFVHLQPIVVGTGLVTYSIDNNATKKAVYDGFGNQLDVSTINSRGDFLIGVYDVTLDGWVVANGDKDFFILSGENWGGPGENIHSNYLENQIQNALLQDIITALGAGGQVVRQIIEKTVPSIVTSTPTKITFDTITTASNDTAYIDVDGNNDHVLLSENTAGQQLLFNVSVLGTQGTPTTSEVQYQLFINGNTTPSDTLNVVVGRDEVVNKPKTITYVVPVGEAPDLLTVKEVLISGSATTQNATFSLITHYTTSSGVPGPASTSTTTLASPATETPSGTSTKQQEANEEFTSLLEESNKVLTLLDATGGLLKINSNNPLNANNRYTFKVPELATNNEVQISVDNGTTYYDLNINGLQALEQEVTDSIINIYFNGTNFMFIDNEQSISRTQQQTARIDSTFNVLAPINGTPEMEAYGLSLYNAVVNGQNILDGNSVTFDSVNGITYYDTLNSVFIVGDGTTKTITNNTGATADIMAIITTNTPLATYTAQDIADMDLPYFEGSKSVEDLAVVSRGVNLFDINNIEEGQIDSAGIPQIATNRFRDKEFEKLKKDTTYYFNSTELVDGKEIKLVAVNYYDSNENFITRDIPSANDTSFTVDINAVLIKKSYGYIDNTDINIQNIKNQSRIILNEGTTALPYVPYNSQTQTVFGEFISAGTVRQRIYKENGIWYNGGEVLTIENVSIGATINDTTIPLIDTNASIFEAYDEVTGERQQGVYGDILTLTNTATVYYKAASPTPTEIIDVDGSLICEEITTISQEQDISTELNITYPLDKDAQLEINTDRLTYQQKEIDKLENEITTLDANKEDVSNKVTAFQTTPDDIHYPSEKLVKDSLDNKVEKDGDKVLSDNNYTDTEKSKLAGIESGATADQTASEIKTEYESNANTNAYTDAEKTKVGHVSVSEAVDLDLVEEVEIGKDYGTGGLACNTATSSPSAVSLDSGKSFSGCKRVRIYFKQLLSKGVFEGALEATDDYMFVRLTTVATSNITEYAGKFIRLSDTTFGWYNGVKIVDGAYDSSSTSLQLTKVEIIK